MPQYLTRRQRQLLDFMEDFIRENGYSPSLEEICSGVGLSSIATVHVHLRNLESKKMIRRFPNRSRSIELLPSARKPPSSGRKSQAGLVELPLLGSVAAGEPIEAVVDEQSVEVPAEFVRGGESFALRVKGDSMIEDQICDGDLIIVERRETAIAGDTVVALVRGSEATVKRFYPQGSNVRLQPANSTMRPIIVPADECEIQGVVIGLLRKY